MQLLYTEKTNCTTNGTKCLIMSNARHSNVDKFHDGDKIHLQIIGTILRDNNDENNIAL